MTVEITPQAAFADYLRSTTIDLWDVDKSDPFAAALDDLALTVDTLQDDDPDAEYLGLFVKDGHFEPDVLLDRLLHRITLNEMTAWKTDREFVSYLVHHHRDPTAEDI
jgi:hypothetical protein